MPINVCQTENRRKTIVRDARIGAMAERKVVPETTPPRRFVRSVLAQYNFAAWTGPSADRPIKKMPRGAGIAVEDGTQPMVGGELRRPPCWKIFTTAV